MSRWSLTSDVIAQVVHLEADLRAEADTLRANYNAQTMTFQVSRRGREVDAYITDLHELADRLDELKETI